MRRIIAAAALLIAPTLFAHDQIHGHHQNISISTPDYEELTSCSQIRVSYDDAPAVRAEEELPVGNLRSLKITSDHNGGIRVAGWDQPRYAVTVCKAAADASLLSQVRARLSGNEVTTDGPEDGQWVAYLLVRTPRNASLDVETHNGPIGLHSVNGTINAHAQNGPISVKDSSGTIDAETVNGPISLAGGSGNVRVSATNGPLSVKLNGSRWDGTLVGTTQNGPLSVRIPHNYGGGVEVTAKGHGPISCKADACRDLQRSWHDDDDRAPRQLSFGSGAKNVTLTTVNGPVSVKEAE
jgi:DUF4097 and DUF4098 domain-containing protein YvlB